MKIAIQGHPTRGKEIIQILRSLGATSYGTYDTCSHPEWYWYINKNREITCDPKRSMCGYKLYTLEEFEKEFPFKIGDRVISIGTNFIGTITNLKENGWYYVKCDNGHFVCICRQNLKPHKEMKEERNITLTLDKAREWYKKGGELKEVALQAYSEEELNSLPRSWEEFCKRYSKTETEAYIGVMSAIYSFTGTKRDRDKYTDKNICPSQKSAEAHLAMIQLEQLRDCWWNGWEPIWDRSEKWCIRLWGNELNIGITTNISRFLTFPTKEMAEEFLKCFEKLIKQAGNLI